MVEKEKPHMQDTWGFFDVGFALLRQPALVIVGVSKSENWIKDYSEQKQPHAKSGAFAEHLGESNRVHD